MNNITVSFEVDDVYDKMPVIYSICTCIKCVWLPDRDTADIKRQEALHYGYYVVEVYGIQIRVSESSFRI